MRISAGELDLVYFTEDRLYERWFAHRFPRLKVTLDGVVVPYCIMADEDLGDIRAYAVDETGKIMLDDFCPVVNKHHGVVRIEIA